MGCKPVDWMLKQRTNWTFREGVLGSREASRKCFLWKPASSYLQIKEFLRLSLLTAYGLGSPMQSQTICGEATPRELGKSQSLDSAPQPRADV